MTHCGRKRCRDIATAKCSRCDAPACERHAAEIEGDAEPHRELRCWWRYSAPAHKKATRREAKRCSQPKCYRPAVAHGLCNLHNLRATRGRSSAKR